MAEPLFSPEQLQKLTEISKLPPEEQKKILPEFLKNLSPEQIKYLQEQQGQQNSQGKPPNCPFCMIAQKQLQSVILYEDDICEAVFDIRPATKGHVLLFPKQHAADFSSLSPDQVSHLFLVAQRFISVLEEIEGCEGVNLLASNGSAAGQLIDHALLNIIPRYANDGLNFTWQAKTTSPEELQQLAQLLSPHLSKLQTPASAPQKSEQQPSEALVENDEEPFADF